MSIVTCSVVVDTHYASSDFLRLVVSMSDHLAVAMTSFVEVSYTLCLHYRNVESATVCVLVMKQS